MTHPTGDLLTFLLRIEWQGSEVHFVCPSCRASRMHGHEKDCDMDQRITRLHQRQMQTVPRGEQE
jgi:hypothetical protein